MKHKWQKTTDGKINEWAVSGGYCNGPKCVECGYSFCEHCNPNGYNSECPGRKGFEIYITDNFLQGNMLGIRWNDKKLFIGFWFFNIVFSFTGLFPACAEVKEE
jgi:hypothetical protein